LCGVGLLMECILPSRLTEFSLEDHIAVSILKQSGVLPARESIKFFYGCSYKTKFWQWIVSWFVTGPVIRYAFFVIRHGRPLHTLVYIVCMQEKYGTWSQIGQRGWYRCHCRKCQLRNGGMVQCKGGPSTSHDDWRPF
jgi:hypothetical protein